MIGLDTRAESGRTRRLEGDEEQRLLAASRGLMRDLIIAALETGCRSGELLSLQWREVPRGADGAPVRIELSAEKTKTRRARTLPVTARLREVLERRQRGPDGEPLPPDAFVFGMETGERRRSYRTAWGATCERAGIPRGALRFHDLRREFASRLLESGATLAEVQAALGHCNITMTSRYLGVTDTGLQRAFARLDAYRAGIIGT